MKVILKLGANNVKKDLKLRQTNDLLVVYSNTIL